MQAIARIAQDTGVLCCRTGGMEEGATTKSWPKFYHQCDRKWRLDDAFYVDAPHCGRAPTKVPMPLFRSVRRYEWVFRRGRGTIKRCWYLNFPPLSGPLEREQLALHLFGFPRHTSGSRRSFPSPTCVVWQAPVAVAVAVASCASWALEMFANPEMGLGPFGDAENHRQQDIWFLFAVPAQTSREMSEPIGSW